jgi:hypothetical protein
VSRRWHWLPEPATVEQNGGPAEAVQRLNRDADGDRAPISVAIRHMARFQGRCRATLGSMHGRSVTRLASHEEHSTVPRPEEAVEAEALVDGVLRVCDKKPVWMVLIAVGEVLGRAMATTADDRLVEETLRNMCESVRDVRKAHRQ